MSEYTSDEKTIARDFVKMYQSFAQSSDAVYANQSIKPIMANSFECMEIKSAVGNEMKAINTSFGEIDFWKSLHIPE